MESSDVSKEILRIAQGILEESEEDVDPRFVEKVRDLKTQLPRLASKKNRRLSQYGIGVIRSRDTVEDLVDALRKVAGG